MIAGIIIGALILLSIIACLLNCLWCGIECCTGCCACCRCLACCCPSGSRSRRRSPKYRDEPAAYYQPPPPPPPQQRPQQQQQWAQAPAAALPQTANAYKSPAPISTYRGARTAQFDSASQRAPGPGSKINEDALPAMPTWDNAVTRRVEDTSPDDDAMEMTPLNPSAQQQRQQPPPQQQQYGMMPAARRNGAPYNSEMPAYGASHPGPYQQSTPAYGYAPYDSHAAQPGRNSPSTAQALSPSPSSPYEDYSYGNYPPQPAQAHSFMPLPQQQHHHHHHQYDPVPQAMSPSADMPSHTAFQQQQPSFGATPPPTYVSDYHSGQPQPAYRSYSPAHSAHPASPPPPFSSAPEHELDEPGRPPSLLQSGRKPVPRSWRDV